MPAPIVPAPHGLMIKGKPAKYVESDVFNVCNRIKEVDRNLSVALQEGHDLPWIVVEMCTDGEERLVKRYAELTPAILDDLRRMIAIPFQQRIDEMQREADLANDVARAQRESGDWERFVDDFQKTLYECGFHHDRTYTSRRNVGDRRKRGGA